MPILPPRSDEAPRVSTVQFTRNHAFLPDSARPRGGRPRGHLAGKLDELLPGLRARFDPIAVHATTSTHHGVLDLLESAGVGLTSAPADPNAIGRHRRGAVALALETGTTGHVLYLDVDHALRWLENDADELDAATLRIRRSDCTVIGRGPQSMAALPGASPPPKAS